MDTKRLGLVAAGCGGLCFVAALLPWVGMPGSMSGSVGFGSLNVKTSWNGTEGDLKGVWLIVLGLLAGGVALVAALGRQRQILPFLPPHPRAIYYLATALFGLATVLVMTDLFRGFGPMSKQFGIFLAFLAPAGGGVASFLAARQSPPLPAATPPPSTPAS